MHIDNYLISNAQIKFMYSPSLFAKSVCFMCIAYSSRKRAECVHIVVVGVHSISQRWKMRDLTYTVVAFMWTSNSILHCSRNTDYNRHSGINIRSDLL